MSAVGDFIKAAHEDVEIGGVTFTVRRRSPQLMQRALGSRYFALVTAAKNAKDVERVRKKVDDKAGEEIARRTCDVYMVSPRLGETTDADADVISFEDLEASGFAAALVADRLGGDMGFTKSYADLMGLGLPATSTPWERCTEPGQAK